uniref:Uncharacterized protein n=1 Tax=Lepeophtheirus salmonis TaxID=72036 RepID=A0A0K2VGA1_LEPSM
MDLLPLGELLWNHDKARRLSSCLTGKKRRTFVIYLLYTEAQSRVKLILKNGLMTKKVGSVYNSFMEVALVQKIILPARLTVKIHVQRLKFISLSKNKQTQSFIIIISKRTILVTNPIIPSV